MFIAEQQPYVEAKMSLPAILLVDDDPLTVRIFQHIFMKAGLKNPLYVVYDGDQAI